MYIIYYIIYISEYVCQSCYLATQEEKTRKKLELKVLKYNSVTITDRPSLIDRPQMTTLGEAQW